MTIMVVPLLPDSIPAYVWPGAASFAVTLIAVPLVRRIAVRYRFYDRPDAGLKPHERPIPYLGGLGMFAGWLAALASACSLAGEHKTRLLCIALGGSVLMLTGLIDDLRHVRPKVRLLIQAAVAILLVYAGVGRTLSAPLIRSFEGSLLSHASGSFVLPMTSGLLAMFLIAGATNATNLIDGMDGLCAGIIAIASIGFLAINDLCLQTAAGEDTGEPVRAALCLGLLGACLAFLVYNFNPASIFMGDSGSLLLGFNVAAIMILFGEQSSWRWIAGCGMVFGFPVLDTALAITRRWLNRRPLFLGDRSHIYDQLRDRGLSVRQTVFVCYAVGVLFAILGGLLVRLPGPYIVAVLALSPLAAGFLCRHAGLLRVDPAGRSGGAD